MSPNDTACCIRVVDFGAWAEKCRTAFWLICAVIDEVIIMMTAEMSYRGLRLVVVFV